MWNSQIVLYKIQSKEKKEKKGRSIFTKQFESCLILHIKYV